MVVANDGGVSVASRGAPRGRGEKMGPSALLNTAGHSLALPRFAWPRIARDEDSRECRNGAAKTTPPSKHRRDQEKRGSILTNLT